MTRETGQTIRHYRIDGEYVHEKPSAVSSGPTRWRGKYEITWSSKRGGTVYFGTATPYPIAELLGDDGTWLKTKGYDDQPAFARIRFIPDAGELERIGVIRKA